jgi:hypothetical protein
MASTVPTSSASGTPPKNSAPATSDDGEIPPDLGLRVTATGGQAHESARPAIDQPTPTVTSSPASTAAGTKSRALPTRWQR